MRKLYYFKCRVEYKFDEIIDDSTSFQQLASDYKLNWEGTALVSHIKHLLS